jgi:hypothetical protein
MLGATRCRNATGSSACRLSSFRGENWISRYLYDVPLVLQEISSTDFYISSKLASELKNWRIYFERENRCSEFNVCY